MDVKEYAEARGIIEGTIGLPEFYTIEEKTVEKKK